ncbi:MAG TPA: hypothetical protein VH186_25215, partial [Chloroflexia bacterium]|nr:hypothetical protein [Chloroflexia bacterium]
PEGSLKKSNFDYRAFSNLDFYCYDPVYDLAGLATELELASIKANLPANLAARQLKKEYEALTGEAVSEERWLLYSWVSYLARNHNPALEKQSPEMTRGLARSFQTYYASVYFADLEPGTSAKGTLCALDVDGVLETGKFGFPALSPASASALRALIRHGYRPVLVTGRSLAEVRERCYNYRLSGGVAEYGGVIYNHRTGETHELLNESERASLQELRHVLSTMEGVYLDSDYRVAVRAYHLRPSGRRHGLSSEEVNTALDRSGTTGLIRSIPGYNQTDFMVVGIDKGTGLREMLAAFEPEARTGEQPAVAFAVGDTLADLPMLRMASQAWAPGHAAANMKNEPVRVTRQAFQAGLKQATAELLGHQPGHCAICRVVPHSDETQQLLGLLEVMDSSKAGKARHALLQLLRLDSSAKYNR